MKTIEMVLVAILVIFEQKDRWFYSSDCWHCKEKEVSGEDGEEGGLPRSGSPEAVPCLPQLPASPAAPSSLTSRSFLQSHHECCGLTSAAGSAWSGLSALPAGFALGCVSVKIWPQWRAPGTGPGLEQWPESLLSGMSVSGGTLDSCRN